MFAFQLDRGKRRRRPGPITGNTLLHLRTAGFIDVSNLSYLSLFVFAFKEDGEDLLTAFKKDGKDIFKLPSQKDIKALSDSLQKD